MHAERLFPVEQLEFGSDDWYTPSWIFERLGIVFDMDVCSPPAGHGNVPANVRLTMAEDGLATAWSGNVWMNPPYSKPHPWAQKFIAHKMGIALVTTSRSRWFRDLWNECDNLVLLPHDLKFDRPDGRIEGIYMPAVLVAMGSHNADLLHRFENRVR